MAKSTTDKVVGLAVAGLLIYEDWTLVNRKDKDTISESVWRVAARRPLVPFLAGLLCGHFFWATPETYENYEGEGENK